MTELTVAILTRTKKIITKRPKCLIVFNYIIITNA